jgi:NAD(P)-dependent dehydrogenase (short-subunit alcohol dehydrogenase family)
MRHILMSPNDPLAAERLGLGRDTFASQTAVVTGGGRGIGREIVRTLAWLGARVVIAEVADSGEEVERLVREAGGVGRWIRTDVSNEADVARLAHATREAYGSADILINNAIVCPPASVLEMAVALWDEVIGVNLRGTFLTCKAFLPEMLNRRRGTIVNMISTDAMPYLSAYMASKAGIAAFSQSLAGEVGESGVRVIALAPGFVDTPGLRGAARVLGPRMGLGEEQFMQLSLHPAYAGAMPAEDAAAATAYLLAQLADEYHGEQVTGYTVLERAGYLRPPRSPFGKNPRAAGEAIPASPGAGPMAEAGAICQRLTEMLKETEAELARLPIFVRPMARMGFRSKAGQSTNDWTRTVADVTALVERLAGGDQTARSELRARRDPLSVLCGKLQTYYRDAPAETARFAQDRDFLRQVEATSQQRIAHIDAWLGWLETV